MKQWGKREIKTEREGEHFKIISNGNIFQTPPKQRKAPMRSVAFSSIQKVGFPPQPAVPRSVHFSRIKKREKNKQFYNLKSPKFIMITD